ncbi:acyl carrier protein 1 [Longispora fulva]|uniref:Acyl carrier protein n=1 Tax=Longispora fulva TaxID=619741 RepID=A0A8J7GDA2_9ACTN|nr:acyl carrier protein [Longispora fulva]MBG6134332.1 acyl carrier protein [Longispora fulva]GIG63041.1 acyl carrier protein 1 [Longispora fulva]
MTGITLDKEQLRQLIAETLDAEVVDVTDTAQFVDDLGADSLMALEVMVVLENTYKVKIDEAELREITCLDTAFDLLVAKTGG